MFVPQLAHNILSVDALDEKGYSTLFATGIGKAFDRSSRRIILTVPRDPLTRLYTLNQSDFKRSFKLTHQSCLAHSCSNLNPIMRIHYIYGHPSAARTRYLCKCLGIKTNLSVKNFECVRNCDICHLVKSKRQKTVQHITRMQILGKSGIMASKDHSLHLHFTSATAIKALTENLNPDLAFSHSFNINLMSTCLQRHGFKTTSFHSVPQIQTLVQYS